jgi:hypothetical protein
MRATWKSTAARKLMPQMAFVMVSLLLMLGPSACGASSGPASTPGQVDQAAPTPTSTLASTACPTSVLTSPASALIFNCTADGTVDGLHVHLENPFGLVGNVEGIACGASFVLARPPASYDASAIQQVYHYVAANSGAFLNNDLPSNAPPSSVQVVPGRFVAQECTGVLEITNVSQQAIEIDRVGLTQAVASVPNVYTYQLIDACTPAQGFNVCYPGGATTPGCDATFSLAPAAAGVHQDSPLRGGPGIECTATLTPGANFDIILRFGSTGPSQRYRVNLTLTLAGKGVVTLPALFTTTLVFAEPSQFVCYQLQRTRVVRISLSTPQTLTCY